MKKIIISLFCMICLAFLFSCGEKEEESAITTEKKPEKLVVYINGISAFFENETEPLYPTRYTVGPRNIDGVITASGGNIFQDALEKYEERTGIVIEIHYLEEYGKDGRPILQELYEDGEKMPDLVVSSKNHSYDYYNMAQTGMLMDFTSYISMDEDRQDDELYFQNVLEAGKINGKQYILPLTFSMNALITSESYLRKIGISVPEKPTYEDILYWLKKSCEEMQDSKGTEAIYESIGLMDGQYIMSILNGAANVECFDDELNSVAISKKTLESIYKVMEVYIKQEYTNLYGYENMTYEQLRNSGQGKKRYIANMMSGQEECIGMFLTGGRGGGFNYYQNLVMDAAYFNSTYNEKGEKMVLVGIPTCDDPEIYSANVDSMMFSFATCEYPQAVYDLMCYLMDYSFIMEAGLSVNRKVTEQQLKEVQYTVLTLCPDDVAWAQTTNGSLTVEEVMDSMVDIEPLDEVHVDSIRYMLDHIEGAGLPYRPLEELMFNRVINEIGSESMTVEEASVWTIDKMEERLVKMDENIAFYDEEYEFELMGWSLVGE